MYSIHLNTRQVADENSLPLSWCHYLYGTQVVPLPVLTRVIVNAATNGKHVHKNLMATCCFPPGVSMTLSLELHRCIITSWKGQHSLSRTFYKLILTLFGLTFSVVVRLAAWYGGGGSEVGGRAGTVQESAVVEVLVVVPPSWPAFPASHCVTSGRVGSLLGEWSPLAAGVEEVEREGSLVSFLALGLEEGGLTRGLSVRLIEVEDWGEARGAGVGVGGWRARTVAISVDRALRSSATSQTVTEKSRFIGGERLKVKRRLVNQ